MDDTLINNNVKSNERAGGKTCAAYLTKPELPRNHSNYVGLFNQGGTCYMNSLIQSLYMNPLFRSVIYSIPICAEDISQPNGEITGQKFDVLIAFQKLLIELEAFDVRAISTKDLTKALGWSSNEGRDQHDVQELNRILFDLLERALFNTPYDGIITNLYKGVYFQQTSCSKCLKGNKSEAEFLDLILQVKDFERIEDSLKAYFSTEVINDYKCENCNIRLDLHKFQKLKRAPPLLTLALFRIGYDYMKDERFKLNTKMEFPLELDLTEYFDADYKNRENNKYELYSVIVHRGNADSGHYFSYTRDLLGEGNYDLEPLVELRKEPIIIEKVTESKKEDEESKMQEADKSKKDDSSKKNKKGNKNKNILNNETTTNTNKNSSQKKEIKDHSNNNNIKHNQNQKKKQSEMKTHPSKNQQKKMDEQYSRFNYDECDHPIKYSNSDLAKNWYQFDDTSITPIRVGRLQKQFQSSESAYILMYMKQGIQFQKPSPPDYLKKYIENENKKLFEDRMKFQEEESSLEITFYLSNNFYIDEFKMLTVKPGVDLDNTQDKFSSKVKFVHKLTEVLRQIKEYYYNTQNRIISLDDILLYDILTRKDSLVLLRRIDVSNNESNLESLKFGHQASYLILLKSNKEEIDPFIIDKQIGHDFEPIEINIVHNGIEKKIKCFSKTSLLDFKTFLKDYFKISFKFNLSFQSNNKTINIDVIGFDKKNNCYLNINQLRLGEKSHIFITIDGENSTTITDYEEKKNCVVKLEECDEVKLIRIRLCNTFEDLLRKIKKKFECGSEIRLRKLNDGAIIFKDDYTKKLETDQIFVEGGARLQIEYGETYNRSEILTKMIIEVGQEKVYKEFIGEEITPLKDLKVFICNELNLKPEEYAINKTNYLNDPIKVFKNENESLKKLGIAEANIIYFQNISSQLYERYNIKIFTNGYQQNCLIYTPINTETNKPVIELSMSKEQTLLEIKEYVIIHLNLQVPADNIRLRVISKRGDAERILRGKANSIKKLRIDNPATLLLEVLEEPENLDDKSIQLLTFLRDSNKGTYYNKKNCIFNYQTTASSDLLYNNLRELYKLDNITVTKHTKSYYNWEIIPESEETGPINLKSSYYSLKDGGVRNNDINGAENDDMQTEEDRNMIRLTKSIIQTQDNNKKKQRVQEKPLRFKTNF